ncbi:class I SAM-dependent methyltransferase [Streptomyces sp. NBC_01498]|uniref:methyltransferase domain-containing protein n=1 Tax=Streptomyces sp. NBC_01498 TaxID=2975870 RepID=UPI002E7B887C|nr:methyltransferase domain-containing protein [Streptomyces sp. NBC_01498]WTL25726.1 class I SAM-dependent methyltransferase [Streptomyces sp. NBC_01498]
MTTDTTASAGTTGTGTTAGTGATASTGTAEAAAWSDDPYADALRTGRGPLFLRRTDGWLLPLDVERWCARADAADLSALRRCEGAVLDIGCGPGRLVAALAARGRRALGVDVSAAAVERTTRLGGTALRRSVFDPLPGEGRWGTVLLIDGNIGIGGDPAGLLRRAGGLLAHGGLIIVETAPVDVDERVRVRVDDGRHPPPPGGFPHFPWARLGTPALLRHGRALGWLPVDQWEAEGRPFVALRRSTVRSAARVTRQSAEHTNSAAVTSSQRARNPSSGRAAYGS